MRSTAFYRDVLGAEVVELDRERVASVSFRGPDGTLLELISYE